MSSTSGKGASDSSDDQRKSSSSETRSLPKPPEKKGAKSLLTTDGGQDVPLLDDDDDIDLLDKSSISGKKKTRMSLSVLFSSKKKNKGTKPAPGRGSFLGFFMPNNAKAAFETTNHIEEEGRIDSVVWRRRESTDMTKSLELDMDIYQYMKERSPSFEEEAAAQMDRPISVLPPKEPTVPKRKPVQTASSLLATVDTGGGVRQDTKIPELEVKKKGGFFRRIFGRRKNKDGTRKKGFASRVMSRMSFRPSYKETKGDDIRKKLAAMEVQEEKKAEKKAEEEGLFRKDSDQTDLSGDSDIDSSLLVKEKSGRMGKSQEAEEEGGRLSKIFDDEDEPRNQTAKKKNQPFLNTGVTKSSDELPQVSMGDRLSNEKIKAEASKELPEQAFSLST